MRNLIIRVLVSFVIFWIPLIPLFLIQPIHVGKDLNEYSKTADVYMYILSFLLILSWIVISDNISRWIIRKFSANGKEQQMFTDLVDIAAKNKFEIEIPIKDNSNESKDINKLTVLFEEGRFIFDFVEKTGGNESE